MADIVYSAFAHFDMAQDYYAPVKGRMAKFGRSPDALRMMTGIMPIVGATREKAQTKFDQPCNGAAGMRWQALTCSNPRS